MEFMLYIRNAGDAKSALTASEHLEFIKKCELYIERLKVENKLVAAQPLVREGFVVYEMVIIGIAPHLIHQKKYRLDITISTQKMQRRKRYHGKRQPGI